MSISKFNGALIAAITVTLGLGSIGQAAMLDGDPQAMVSGTAQFDQVALASLLGLPAGVKADLEYAVYEPDTDWAASALGADPRTGASPANALVYAYKIVNTGTTNAFQSIKLVSVGFTDAIDLDNDTEDLFEIGSIASSGHVAPTAAQFEGAPATTQARWKFEVGLGIGLGQSSDILFYTALGPPEDDASNLAIFAGLGQGGVAVPTPTPEPASLALVALGGLIIGRRHRR